MKELKRDDLDEVELIRDLMVKKYSNKMKDKYKYDRESRDGDNPYYKDKLQYESDTHSVRTVKKRMKFSRPEDNYRVRPIDKMGDFEDDEILDTFDAGIVQE